MDVDDDDSTIWRDSSWSWRGSSWNTGRCNEHYRAGHMGGRERHGDRGGKNSRYFAGYYKAKAKGKGYVRAYIAKNGVPPSRGGQCFHSRKEEDDAENADPAR